MTAPTNTTKISNQDLKPQKLNDRTFDFLWWRDSRRKNVLKKEENQKKKEDLIEVKIIESKTKSTFFHKTSFDFFKNIKKHIQIKKLTHKSKQRVSNNNLDKNIFVLYITKILYIFTDERS